MTMFTAIRNLHDSVFGSLKRHGDLWLTGALARFAFAAVLSVYYFQSFLTKIGPGALGPLTVADNAYYQILPSIIDAAGNDVANVALPFKLVVWAGTYAELILPLLVVVGLFARLASLGMIGFILVQSLVDVVFHGIGAEATGAWFDRMPDAVIFDQRLMWIVPLAMIAINGAGRLSLDGLLTRQN
jgi:putative oxidoreductase